MNVPDHPQGGRWALQDFRDAVYYPTVCFLEGGNPYDSVHYFGCHPVGQPFPPYSPLTFGVYLPFAFLSHGASQVLYFLVTILLTVVLAAIVLRFCGRSPSAAEVSGLAALILASRPGHWNLLLGQTTIPLVIAVYATLYFRSRSVWASGLAFAFVGLKPTFGIALGLLLVLLRDWRPVVAGALISLVALVVPTAQLARAAGGMPGLWRSLWKGYSELSGVSAESVTRVDAIALIGRFTGRSPGAIVEILLLGLLITAAAVAIARVRSRISSGQFEAYFFSFTSIALLISVYQLSYAALLLVLPLTCLALGRVGSIAHGVSKSMRNTLIVLLLVPMVNYGASYSIAGRFEERGAIWMVLTSVNSLALLAAFGLFLLIGFKVPLQPPPANSSIADSRGR
jgi:hypothetical protein